jgi:hypothetical protein
LKSNQLSGAIPASLGDLDMLVRLDLSSNNLIGSIPTSLASIPSLKILDVHNNTLSGNVPPGMINLLLHLFNFIDFYPFLFFFLVEISVKFTAKQNVVLKISIHFFSTTFCLVVNLSESQWTTANLTKAAFCGFNIITVSL